MTLYTLQFPPAHSRWAKATDLIVTTIAVLTLFGLAVLLVPQVMEVL